jgi:cobalamin biosynthesis Mg chelatase CobN
MHRLATIPGGWNPAAEGVIFVEQQPAPIAFITAADTDIQTLAVAATKLPADFPQVRVVNLLQLQQQLTIDTYAEDVLTAAQVIIVRLIGGQSYWSYGLEVVQETARQTGAVLIVLPGDERSDPTLMSHSTASLADVDRVWQYLIEGGVDNYRQLLNFIASRWLDFECEYRAPEAVPRVGIYDEARWLPDGLPLQGGAAIIFYRAHYLSGNLAAIEALCQALVDRNLTPVPIYVSSLKDPVVAGVLISYCQQGVDVLLNTTSFSLASLDTDTPQVDLWATMNLPVFQVILSGAGKEFWESGWQGLTPRDMAMNVALPEVDGRIITRAISFKAVQTQNSALQTDVLVYEPVPDRVEFVAELALNWSKLRQKSVKERKVALILANYPTRDGRLANGVGLDTPQSCVEILHALKAAGYQVGDIPADSGELIELLTAGVTNDPEGDGWRKARQSLSREEYRAHFETLPILVQQGIVERWGAVDGLPPQPPLERGALDSRSVHGGLGYPHFDSDRCQQGAPLQTSASALTPLLGGAGGGFHTETELAAKPCRIVGDAVEILEEYAAELVENLIEQSIINGGNPNSARLKSSLVVQSPPTRTEISNPPTRFSQHQQRFQPLNPIGTHTQAELDWISTRLLPALQQTPQEMTNLLRGLNGEYIASGASGAPTRGKPEVLPTGRNFYSVDIRVWGAKPQKC